MSEAEDWVGAEARTKGMSGGESPLLSPFESDQPQQHLSDHHHQQHQQQQRGQDRDAGVLSMVLKEESATTCGAAAPAEAGVGAGRVDDADNKENVWDLQPLRRPGAVGGVVAAAAAAAAAVKLESTGAAAVAVRKPSAPLPPSVAGSRSRVNADADVRAGVEDAPPPPGSTMEARAELRAAARAELRAKTAATRDAAAARAADASAAEVEATRSAEAAQRAAAFERRRAAKAPKPHTL
jgi:hypothetical protein